MSAGKMQELLKEWQHRLMLDDWRIELEANCIPCRFAIQEACGESEWEESIKTAVIKILDKRDYGNRILPYDEEQTLVHELLHLKFSLLDNSGNKVQDRLIHQLVDELSRAFVAAKRHMK